MCWNGQGPTVFQIKHHYGGVIQCNCPKILKNANNLKSSQEEWQYYVQSVYYWDYVLQAILSKSEEKVEEIGTRNGNGDHIVNIWRRRKKWNPHPNRQFSRTSLQPSSFIKPTPCLHHCEDHKAPFTLGVSANVQPKSSIPIGVALYWQQKLKNGTIELIWEANLQPLVPNNKPKMLKVGPSFFSPDS